MVAIDKCPKCHCLQDKVVDSRINENGIRFRRRECLTCGHRWNTVEICEDDLISLTRFDPEKYVQKMKNALNQGLEDIHLFEEKYHGY